MMRTRLYILENGPIKLMKLRGRVFVFLAFFFKMFVFILV